MLLLIAVAIIYFIIGQNNEAYFMIAASGCFWNLFYQDNRSRKALEALEN
jgi:Ca2+-transporting ATPase